jgi:hypothetical protein
MDADIDKLSPGLDETKYPLKTEPNEPFPILSSLVYGTTCAGVLFDIMGVKQ